MPQALQIILFGSVVASISSLATMIAFFAVNTSLIVLRYSDPSEARPFRVPLSIGRVPVLPVLGAASSLVFITQFNAVVYFFGGVFIVMAAALFRWKENGLRA